MYELMYEKLNPKGEREAKFLYEVVHACMFNGVPKTDDELIEIVTKIFNMVFRDIQKRCENVAI